MEVPSSLFPIFAVCLSVLCLCQALEGSDNEGIGLQPAGFSPPYAQSVFQSWLAKRSFDKSMFDSDKFQQWLAKRGFDKSMFDKSMFDKDKFQQWMKKRGMLSTNGGGLGSGPAYSGSGKFQSWMKKRGLLESSGEPAFGKGQFQKWVKKRGLLQPSGEPKFDGGFFKPSGSFQQWVKKRSFAAVNSDSGPINALGPMNKAQFQAWNDWLVKRGMAPLGSTDVDNFFKPSGGQFQSWDDYISKKASLGTPQDLSGLGKMQMQPWHMYKRASDDKRQLGNSPVGFGHYREYFTNGLQDWRNTFQSTKRTLSDAKVTKEEKDN